MRVAVTNSSESVAEFITIKAGPKNLVAPEKYGKTVLEYTEGLIAASK